MGVALIIEFCDNNIPFAGPPSEILGGGTSNPLGPVLTPLNYCSVSLIINVKQLMAYLAGRS